MLMQSTAIEARKWLEDDEITGRVKEICLMGVVCKVSNRKTFSGETFCLPEILLSIIKFGVPSNFFTHC